MNEQQVLAAFGQLADTLSRSQDRQQEALTQVVRQVSDQGLALKTVLEQNASFLQNEAQDRRREGLMPASRVTTFALRAAGIPHIMKSYDATIDFHSGTLEDLHLVTVERPRLEQRNTPGA